MSTPVYLFGRNPLKEMLAFCKRTGEVVVDSLFVTKNIETDKELMSLIHASGLRYMITTTHEIESLIGREAVHQGILVKLKEERLYTSFDEMASLVSKKERPLLLLLDELQDPHNVGAIIRSAVAFGADAVLLPEHRTTHLTGTVIKSAAGTNFSIPIVRIGNVTTTLLALKEKGFWIYGLTGSGDTLLTKAVFDTPSVIVVGSEGEGIAKKTLEHCDFRLSIPMDAKCESLNASNAVAVTLYEWSRQNPGL